METTRELVPWGRMAWAELSSAVEGVQFTCAWADYSGFHVGSFPLAAPPYTHLWGWNDEGSLLLRCRIDEGDAIAGWLVTPPGSAPDGRTACAASQTFTVAVNEVLLWGPDDQQVGPQDPDIHRWTMRSVELLTDRPVTFIWGSRQSSEN